MAFFCFAFSACNSEPTFDTTLLKGKWDVDHAERDGKITKSLNKGSFSFFDHDRMMTNILKTQDTISYQVSKNNLKLDEGEYKFNVLKITIDSLVLRTRINKSNYTIHLLKGV